MMPSSSSPSPQKNEARAGWPRPFRSFEPEAWQHDQKGGMLPVPWILDGKDGWTVFGGAQARASHDDRLCQVCGEALGRVVVLGALSGRAETSGPGCHPRCAALAVSFCPHLDRADDAIVAWLYEGDGPGYVLPEGGFFAEPFMDPVEVDGSARPLTAARVRGLAASDPLGRGGTS